MADTNFAIALDAMGGDNAPDEIVEGAVIAAKDFGVEVVLVGDEKSLGSGHGLQVIHASEVIEMGAEPAAAVRAKKDASVVVAAKAVSDGTVAGMVSAGNTGAAMAASLLKIGRIKGISRPAIAVPFPVVNSTPTTVLDVGANADCQPEWLQQFAQLGTTYARHRWKINKPKLAILTIGEEAGKGNSLVKDVCSLFEGIDWDAWDVDFIGNIEGHDLLDGTADVVVCDGFTGNVVLKSLEGVYDLFSSQIKARLKGSAVADAATELLTPMMDELDPVNVGTGMLLGVKGVSMIAHGSSTPAAIANALKTADALVKLGMVDLLRSELDGSQAEKI